MSDPLIAIVEDDEVIAQMLGEMLRAQNYRVEWFQDHPDPGRLETALVGAHPDLILLDLGLPWHSGHEVCRNLRGRTVMAQTPILVMTGQRGRETLLESLKCGANDYMVKPVDPEALQARIRSLLGTHRQLQRLQREKEEYENLIEFSRILTGSMNLEEIARTVVDRLASMFEPRASAALLQLCDNDTRAEVLADSRHERYRDETLDLREYPELERVIESRFSLIVEDTQTDPLLAPVRERIRNLPFRAIVALPILDSESMLGILVVRLPSPLRGMEPMRMRLLHLLANLSAIPIRNATLFAALRRQTESVEEQLRRTARYRMLFDYSSDALLTIDSQGQVGEYNRALLKMLGLRRGELSRSRYMEMVAPESHGTVQEVYRAFMEGRRIPRFELTLLHREGHRFHVDVRAAALPDQAATIVSLRDITAERALREELMETMDFLEAVIANSADAIAAADPTGVVIIFNRSAEEVTGYSANEVIGRMHWSDFYTEKGAQEIAEKMASPDYGGVGRVTNLRYRLRNKAGEAVPLLVSANTITKDDQVIATMAIFTDLREKLKIAQELEQKNKEIMGLREKQSVASEIAGAAAHELNQPITSLIGYIELLEREPDEAKRKRLVSTLMKEAERLADTVKRIGSVREYRTRTYAGSSRILDVDAAKGKDDDSAVRDSTGDEG